MAIDGRTLTQQPKDAGTEAYESKGLAVAAALIVWVPIAAFVAFTYWTGAAMFGGVTGGVLSLLETAGFIGFFYFKKRFGHRR